MVTTLHTIHRLFVPGISKTEPRITGESHRSSEKGKGIESSEQRSEASTLIAVHPQDQQTNQEINSDPNINLSTESLSSRNFPFHDLNHAASISAVASTLCFAGTYGLLQDRAHALIGGAFLIGVGVGAVTTYLNEDKKMPAVPMCLASSMFAHYGASTLLHLFGK